MRFHCDSCGRGYSVTDGLRGRAFKLTCKGCGRPIVVPASGAAPALSLAPLPAENPFRVAPVAVEQAEPPAEDPAVSAPAPVAPLRVQAAPAALATAAPMDAEEMRLALSEFFDPPGTAPAAGTLDDEFLDLAIGEVPRRRRAARATRPLAGRSDAFAWPAASANGVAAVDLFATATRPSAGPRIALGLAAAAVVAIVAAVLFVPRGGAPARVASTPSARAPEPKAEPTALPAPAATPAAEHGQAQPPAAAVARVPRDAVVHPTPERVAKESVATAEVPRIEDAPAPPAAARKDRNSGAPRAAVATPLPASPQQAGPGKPSNAQLARVLSRNRAGFDACVAEAAGLDPGLDLRGRTVTLVVTVTPTGAVTDPSLDDSRLGPDLGACLTGVARKMTVPAFDGDPVRVEVPLALSPAR